MGRRIHHLLIWSAALAIGAAACEPRAMPASHAVASPSLRTDGSDTLTLANLQEQFESLASKLAPSVVAISATDHAIDCDALYRANQLTPRVLSSLVFDKAVRTVGTGFVIDGDGDIVTNQHVVEHAAQLWITTDDHTVYPALVVGSDPRVDLAVLKVPTDRLPPVRFAANAPQRGQWALAIGNPFGLCSGGEMSLSVGVVSGIDRSLPKLADDQARAYYGLIQTTAEINPGNSGGPLFNLAGEVIGINAAVLLPQQPHSNGLGFALPTDEDVMRTIACLRVGRPVQHGYLGVVADDPTPAERAVLPPTVLGGAKLDTVDASSPASTAGLHVGDVVTAINGVAVRNAEHFVRTLNFCRVDQPTSFTLQRDGRAMQLSATLLRRTPAPSTAISHDTQQLHWHGLVLGNVDATDDDAGVVVRAADRTASPPADAKPGMLITAIAGQPVRDVATLLTILNQTPAERCALTIEPRISRLAGADLNPLP